MQGLISYSGLTAKIRAMQGNLLTDAQLREIVSLPTVSAVVSYLKQKPAYERVLADMDENQLHRGQVEPILRKTVYLDFSKIYCFANQKQREFLSTYFIRYEVYFLKECLTRIFDLRNEPINLSVFKEFFDRHSKLPFDELTSASTIEEFLACLTGTEYYSVLSVIQKNDSPTLFDYEMTLDLFYFKMLWEKREKLVSSYEIQELTNILGAKFDMLNIQWIYRCKKYYHMAEADIYALLIPVNDHLSKDEIKNMVETEDLGALDTLISQSYYSRHFKNYTESTLEASYSHILKKILKRESRNNPYSVATIYSYLYHKEHEVDELVIALECVRYQIAADTALTHVACR